jgi:hypothetical protein
MLALNYSDYLNIFYNTGLTINGIYIIYKLVNGNFRNTFYNK